MSKLDFPLKCKACGAAPKLTRHAQPVVGAEATPYFFVYACVNEKCEAENWCAEGNSRQSAMDAWNELNAMEKQSAQACAGDYGPPMWAGKIPQK